MVAMVTGVPPPGSGGEGRQRGAVRAGGPVPLW